MSIIAAPWGHESPHARAPRSHSPPIGRNFGSERFFGRRSRPDFQHADRSDTPVTRQGSRSAIHLVPEVPAGYTIGIVGGRLMPSGGENMHTTKATYYRIKVEADNVDHVSSCQGRLVSIEKAGKLILEGEPITLPFAPSERSDAISKTIHKDAPEYLDFLAITDDAHSTSRQQLSVFAARSIKFPVIPKKR